MLSQIFQQRLTDLLDNITQDQKLLKEFEEALTVEDNPRTLKKYKKEIKRQQESIDNYRQEYTELEQQLTGIPTPQIQVVGNQLQIIENQLQQIDAKLNIVLINQDSLLIRYQASEQAILRVFIEQLNQTQLAFTENMLNAVAANQVSESEMLQMLAVLESRIPSLPSSSQAEIAEIIKSPELDARHKITVTLPIVPFLINYEGELELGTGFNIKSAWEFVIKKLGRK
jgi:septal ring factor EnvC (AmiA/AmiB activator)